MYIYLPGKKLEVMRPVIGLKESGLLEEKSVDEIASALRRPPKTVHTQIYRAKQLLQNAIERGNGHGIVQ